MLVLKRHTSERIRIGDDITLLVVELGKGFVRIGIDAPREIEIHREEIYQLRKQQAEELGQTPHTTWGVQCHGGLEGKPAPCGLLTGGPDDRRGRLRHILRRSVIR